MVRTLRISEDTFELIRRLRLTGESSNDTIWRALNFYAAKLQKDSEKQQVYTDYGDAVDLIIDSELFAAADRMNPFSSK
jgi:hypothetical protein